MFITHMRLRMQPTRAILARHGSTVSSRLTLGPRTRMGLHWPHGMTVAQGLRKYSIKATPSGGVDTPPSAAAASAAAETAHMPPKPPKRGRFARWMKGLWRLTLLSMLGGTAYVGYSIWKGQHPPVQAGFDPTKKTLVILGTGWASIAVLKNIDTSLFNVVIVSPRNYFLFTPLLPSCTTGTLELRSIIEPIRYITRFKKASVKFYEAECTKVNPEDNTIEIFDCSEIKGTSAISTIKYDHLIVGVGAENATFGIPGVDKYACFLKEIWHARKIRANLLDCIESAAFKDQTDDEKKRLLHMVVVGGGPTGIEFAAELRDFLVEDLTKWFPELTEHFSVSLVEALPSVLPMFSKRLIEYTESTFKEEHITIHTKTMVKAVTDRTIEVEIASPDGKKQESMPYGLLVWATGNTPRPLIKDLMSKIPEQVGQRRGLAVNEFFLVNGTSNIWCLGDASATQFAATAQVANQQGSFLARLFNSIGLTEKYESELQTLQNQLAQSSSVEDCNILETHIKDLQHRIVRTKQMRPFKYTHQGSLAYIGSDKAIADLPFGAGNVATGGAATFYFWRYV